MLLFIIIWILFLALHSVLAGAMVKAKIIKYTGLPERGYRVAYNFFNFIYLLLVLIVLFNTDSMFLFNSSVAFKLTGIVLAIAGAVLILYCFRHYQLSQFIGLKEEVNMKLNIKGPNRFVRHPLYAGTILLVMGICIYKPVTVNWVFFLLMLIYIIIGIEIEEKKLIRIFRDDYERYRKRTKKLIPFIY
ncbi:MAG: DUF1295 domain-containing protein [Chitinophagaceae bacterium]|nr:DUF1295 domain-containing protein [Chitinophagaceae bacterium]